jgi:hypothetical protein
MMKQNHGNVVILNHPALDDIQFNRSDVLNNQRRQMFMAFQKRSHDIDLNVEYMMNHFPELKTEDVDPFEWYSKNDHHPTTAFQRNYAEKVARYLLTFDNGIAF